MRGNGCRGEISRGGGGGVRTEIEDRGGNKKWISSKF